MQEYASKITMAINVLKRKYRTELISLMGIFREQGPNIHVVTEKGRCTVAVVSQLIQTDHT